MTQLAPCPHCKRHLRVTETQCPFCAGSVAGQLTPKQSKPLYTRGLSRAGILALGASLATVGVLAEGCVEELEPEDEDDGKQVPVYGAPVQTDAGTPKDSGVGPIADAGVTIPDSSIGVPVYGAPVQLRDAGVYGAPIQPDAGKPDAGQADAGRLVPVYGAPIAIYGAPIQPPVDSTED